MLDVLCSAQRALLGYVTPNLRAVYVEFLGPDDIRTVFYYDHRPTEEEEELANCADTEMLSDFPDFDTSFAIKTIPYPEPLSQPGRCVYLRYEPQTTEG